MTQALSRHDAVAFAAVTTGRAAVFAMVQCRDTDALYDYLADELAALPGIGRMETALVQRRAKRAARSSCRWRNGRNGAVRDGTVRDGNSGADRPTPNGRLGHPRRRLQDPGRGAATPPGRGQRRAGLHPLARGAARALRLHLRFHAKQ